MNKKPIKKDKKPLKKKIVRTYKKKLNKDVNDTGRKTLYKEEYNELAFKYCLLGASDAKLAEFFDVNVDTIQTWKKEYPLFSDSIREGKEEADSKIAESLYNRALGRVSITEEKSDANGGYTIKKQLPPDVTAMIFWLRNRQKDKWRDQQNVDHTSEGKAITFTIEKTYSESENKTN